MNSEDSDKTIPDYSDDRTLDPSTSDSVGKPAPAQGDPDLTIGPASAAANPTIDPDQTLGPGQASGRSARNIQQTIASLSGFDSSQRKPVGERNIQIEGYEILDELGRGGMGVVYKARDTALNRIVALKMILAGAHASDEAIARFRTEAEAVAQLQHRGIVQVYDVGQSAGQPWCALEFIDGGGLDELMEQDAISISEAVSIVEELAHAMSSAHQAGIVHRDLKPANVLISKGDAGGSSISLDNLGQYRPKITDFGLAKKVEQESRQTRTGAIMGTPAYMAPEQARGAKRIGPAADLYSLGAILYHLLTGQPPFSGDTPIKTIMKVINDPPVSPRSINPSVDRDLDTIVLKCLEKEPGSRYASAEHLAQDLHRYQAGMPIEARPVSGVERVGKWIRRKPWAASLIALAITGLLATIIGGILFNRQLASAYARVDEEHDRAVKALEAEKRALVDTDRALKRAEESESASRQRLVDNFVNNAMLAMNNNDMLGALPWFSEALALETDADRLAVHQKRFSFAVQNAPKPERTWILDCLIRECRFSADGTRLAAIEGIRRVSIWDIRSNRKIQDLKPPGNVEYFFISDDFERAIVLTSVVRSFEGMQKNWRFTLWDVAEREQIGEPLDLPELGSGFYSQVAASRGWIVLKSDTGNSIDVYSIEKNSVVKTIETETSIDRFHIDPHGKFLLLGSRDHFELWDLESETKRADIHPENVTADHDVRIAFLHDLIVLAADKFHVFKPGEAEPFISYPRTRESGKPEIALRHDGRSLAVAWPDGSFELYGEDAGRINEQRLRSQPIKLFFSHDGEMLFVANRFEVLKFNAQDGVQIGSAIPATLKPLHSAVVSPDDSTLAIGAGTGVFAGGNGCIRIWDVVDSEGPGPIFENHAGDDAGLSLSGNGMHVASISNDGNQLNLSSPQSSGAKYAFQLTADELQCQQIRFAKWNQDGTRLVVATADDQIVLVDPATRQVSNRWTVDGMQMAELNATGNRVAIVAGQNGSEVTLFDTRTGQPVFESFTHRLQGVIDMAFLSPTNQLATLSRDMNLRLFDLESGDRIWKIPAAMVPTTMQVHSREELAVLGGERFGELPGTLRAIDLATGKDLWEPLQFDSPARLVEISPNGGKIAVADDNGVVRLFNVRDGSLAGPPIVHPDTLNRISFSRNSLIFATICRDGAVRLFDTRNCAVISAPVTFGAGFQDAAFIGDGFSLCGILGGTPTLWPVRFENYSKEHAAALSRFLSGQIISEAGTIVPASSDSLKEDFSNVTIRQMMDGKMLRQIIGN